EQKALEHDRHRERHPRRGARSEEHTSELQSHLNLVCRLLLEKKKKREEIFAVPMSLTFPWVQSTIGLFYLDFFGPSFVFFRDRASTEMFILPLRGSLAL